MTSLDEVLFDVRSLQSDSTELVRSAEAIQECVSELCSRALQRFSGPQGAGTLLRISTSQVTAESLADSLRRGEVFDLVYIVPEAFALLELLSVIEDEVRQVAQAVGAAGGDGLLQSPGLEFHLKGIAVKLLLSNGADVSDVSPDSLSGRVAGLVAYEVAKHIVDSVPDLGLFQKLLLCVRHWAKQRGIYGQCHDFGYMGGMAWSLCCAWVCQIRQYPSLEALLVNFFEVLCRWDPLSPIQLVMGSHKVPQTEGYQVMLPVGRNLSATPHMTASATHHVQKELRRAYRICMKWQRGTGWRQLFSCVRFFDRHLHFLRISVTASSDAIMRHWFLYCRRHLQGLPEAVEGMRAYHLQARPWPVWIAHKDPDWQLAKTLFVGLRVPTQKQAGRQVVDLREALVQILEQLCAWPYATQHVGDFDLFIRHMSREQVEMWLRMVEQGLTVQRSVPQLQ